MPVNFGAHLLDSRTTKGEVSGADEAGLFTSLSTGWVLWHSVLERESDVEGSYGHATRDAS